jgi:hypothetical protein
MLTDEEIRAIKFNTSRPQMRELTTRLLDAEARVKVLEDALREMVYETTHLSPQEDDGSHWAKISAAALGRARTALQEQSK